MVGSGGQYNTLTHVGTGKIKLVRETYMGEEIYRKQKKLRGMHKKEQLDGD